MRFLSARSVTFEASCRVTIDRFRNTRRFFSYASNGMVFRRSLVALAYLAVGILEAIGGHFELAILRVALAEFVEREDIRRLQQSGFAQIVRGAFIVLGEDVERTAFPVGEQRALARIADLLCAANTVGGKVRRPCRYTHLQLRCNWRGFARAACESVCSGSSLIRSASTLV